ncbi:MAG TPA: DUF4124 domain-containing protein [Methylophilaceae bacterium]|nr:DUF4124 domain-containing protein [Methylophilaceae bacterium]
MKTSLGIALLLLPALVQAETMYKCKSPNGDAVYSEHPCNAKSSKKVILKDNTLDHSEMRHSKLYKPGQPVQVVTESSDSVTSMKKIEGAGFKEFPPSNTGSSYTNVK